MKKYLFLSFFLIGFIYSLSAGERFVDNKGAVNGPHEIRDNQETDFLQSFENRRFFLWRWLFGEKKTRSGIKGRVSPSDGVIRAPIAEPDKVNSNSRNPANVGSRPKRAKSRSFSPASVGASAGSAKSGSISPADLGGSSKGSQFGTSNRVFGNNKRPALSSSFREDFLGGSQNEIGISFGSAHAFTDFTGTSSMSIGENFSHHINNFDITFGIFSRFRVTDWFGIGLAFDYTNFAGVRRDDLSEEDLEIYSFKNQFFELGGRLEFFVPMSYRSNLDLYGFAGFSVSYNNPRIFDGGGNRMVISESVNLFQPALPIGVGICYRILPRFKLGVESGFRYLVYNYLDGVMLMGTNDSFLLNQVKISYRLPSRRY